MGRAQDCVALQGNGPDESLTYISGFSCTELRATKIFDPSKDEIPTSPMQAARIAADYIRNYPNLQKDWVFDNVRLDRYDFPEGSRWYYIVEYLSPSKDIPRFRPRVLLIAVSSDGKLGFLKPEPKK
jgi:hypothetical protein